MDINHNIDLNVSLSSWEDILTNEEYISTNTPEPEGSKFVANDLNLLRYFLKIKIASSLKEYFLSQFKYTDDLLDCYC